MIRGDRVGFKVGDRVECTMDYPDGNSAICVGATGTIVAIGDRWDNLNIGVCWDEDVHGSTLGGCCEAKHGWWVSESDIILMSDAVFEVGQDDELLQLIGATGRVS